MNWRRGWPYLHMAQGRIGGSGHRGLLKDRSAQPNRASLRSRASPADTARPPFPSLHTRDCRPCLQAICSKKRRSSTCARIVMARPALLELIVQLIVVKQLRLHDQERTILIRNAHGIAIALIVRIHFVSNHSYWFVSLCCRADTLTSDIGTALTRRVVVLDPICKFFSLHEKNLRFLQVFLTLQQEPAQSPRGHLWSNRSEATPSRRPQSSTGSPTPRAIGNTPPRYLRHEAARIMGIPARHTTKATAANASAMATLTAT